MKALIQRFLTEETGVTAIEYGLIAGLIAVVIIGSVSGVGAKLNTLFTNIASSVASASS